MMALQILQKLTEINLYYICCLILISKTCVQTECTKEQLSKHDDCCTTTVSCSENHVCINYTCFCPSNCTDMIGKKICDCSTFWDKRNETFHNLKEFLKKINPLPPYYNWCSGNFFQCFFISATVIYFVGAFTSFGVKSFIIHRQKKLRQQRNEISGMWRIHHPPGQSSSLPHTMSDDGSLDRMIPMPEITVNRPSFLQRLQYGRPVIHLQGYVINNGTVVPNTILNYDPPSILNSMQASSAPATESCLIEVDVPPNYNEIANTSRPPSFSPPPSYDECILNTSL